MINASNGFHVWSERYDRELTDIFALQDEITQAIAEVLRVKLSPQTAAPRRYEPNLRAYDAYLKARDLWFKRTTPEWLVRFRELLERAIELDSKFALASCFLGVYYTMQANFGFKLASEVIPSAVAAEKEALRVDPSLPEAHALLAVCVGELDYDWSKAEQHRRLAMTCEPVSRDVLFRHGNHYLLPVGRTHDALDAMKRGLQGDPLNLLYRHHYARGLCLACRLEDAETELRTILEIDDNDPHALGTLGSICAQQRKYDEALVLTEKAHALMPWSKLAVGQLAAILVRTGGVSRANDLIDKLKTETASGDPLGWWFFTLCAGKLTSPHNGRKCDRAALHALRSGPGSVPTAHAQVARAIENDESSELSLALTPVGLQTALPVTRMCALRIDERDPGSRETPHASMCSPRIPGGWLANRKLDRPRVSW